MKRKFLAGLAIVFVIFGTLTPVFGFLGARFETNKVSASPDGTPAVPTRGPGDPIYNATTNTVVTTNAQGQIVPYTPPAAKDILDCTWYDLVCSGVIIIGTVLTAPPQFLAGISGALMDWTLSYTVDSQTYRSQDLDTQAVGSSSFVVTGWRLVRDFSNLVFIFALFAIAFNLILSGTGMSNIAGLEPKRAFALVIIMALLVNFSFFMCRALIDVSNQVANIFYNQAGQLAPAIDSQTAITHGTYTQATNASGIAAAAGKISNFYVSNTNIHPLTLLIVDKINPQSFLLNGANADSTTRSGIEPGLAGYGLYLFIAIMAALFNLFLVYIFISTALFLVGRTIGLWFMIILSPMAFVSVTIPGFKKTSYVGFDDWFKQFLGLAFLAPIYIFFIFLTIVFLNIPSLKIGGSDGGYLALAVMVMAKLALTGIVLIFGKSVAKDMSGKVGAFTSTAITGLAIGAAGLGVAVASGGMAGQGLLGSLQGAAVSGGKYIANNAETAARSVMGDEKVDQWKTKLSGLRNFNMSKLNKGEMLVAGLAAITGSKKVKQAGDEMLSARDLGLKTGRRYGNNEIYERAKRHKAIREEREKKIKALDDRIADVNRKKKLAGTPAEKVRLDNILKGLKKEKADLQTPAPIPGPNPTPNPNPNNGGGNNGGGNGGGGGNNNNNNGGGGGNNNNNGGGGGNNNNNGGGGGNNNGGGNGAGGNNGGGNNNNNNNNGNNNGGGNGNAGGNAGGAGGNAGGPKNSFVPPRGPVPANKAEIPKNGEGLLLRNTFNGNGKFEDEKAAGAGGAANTKPDPLIKQRADAAAKYDKDIKAQTDALEQMNQAGLSNADTQTARTNLKNLQDKRAAELNQLDDQIAGKKPVNQQAAQKPDSAKAAPYEPIFGSDEADEAMRAGMKNPTGGSEHEGGHKVSEEINAAKTSQNYLENITTGGAAAEKPKFGQSNPTKMSDYSATDQERFARRAEAAKTRSSDVASGIERKQEAIASAERTAVAKEEAQKTTSAPVQETKTVSSGSVTNSQSFISGAQDVHGALNTAAAKVSSVPGNYSLVPNETLNGIKEAQTHLQNAINAVRTENGSYHESLHKSLDTIHTALGSVSSAHPIDTNSEAWEHQKNALADLDATLRNGFNQIHQSLTGDQKKAFEEKAKTVLGTSDQAVKAITMKTDSSNNKAA